MTFKTKDFLRTASVTALTILAAGGLCGSAWALGSAGAQLPQPQTALFHSAPILTAADQATDTPGKEASGPSITAAKNFVNAMAKKTVSFLADQSLSEKQKKEDFRTLLFADFDMDTIGRFVLGTYWNRASADEKQEYLHLFREMIANVWAERFEQYKGQKFELRGARADGAKDTLVSSAIIPLDNPEVQVDWRVRYKNGQYKIVDVVVEGVSLSVTQRSDFSSVIQRGGGDVKVLLASLRQQVK